MTNPLFAQGARCGHCEGKDRAGLYTLNEEIDASWIAVQPQQLHFEAERWQWVHGYRLGYLLACEGARLPREYQHAVDRKPKSWI